MTVPVEHDMSLVSEVADRVLRNWLRSARARPTKCGATPM
jgi:hypothetical protein